MTGTKIGYARVSTLDQNLNLQTAALNKAGCDRIYEDHGISGSTKARSGLQDALKAVSEGDTLVVWRLDRMGRSLRHLIDINDELERRGIAFESLSDKIDSSTATGKFVFQILCAVAELERNVIRERTLAGLAEAAKRGRYPGRPRKCVPCSIADRRAA